MSFDCDVAVIGGGPAGAAAAAWLARHGQRVVLFERDRFPRFHIGESLLASVNDVLEEIGAADLIRAAKFPVKWGATFMPPDGSVERVADFTIAAGEVRQPQTWQVCREEFDDLLLRHAASSGADVREGHRVLDVSFDRDGVDLDVAHTGAPGPPAEKQTMRVRARAVIDGSGRASLLAQRFELRRHEPDLANVAVFSHYTGVPRRQGRRAGDIRVDCAGGPGLVLDDPDLGRADERGGGPAPRRVQGAPAGRAGRPAHAPHRRHSRRRAPDDACSPALAGARRA